MSANKDLNDKFEKLVAIMAQLRGPSGCPWDKEQTHESLRQYLLEEAYEVLEALDTGDTSHLKEELGDLLLQIVFHAQIASENQAFDISDVIQSIAEKLIRRHPNVFGDQIIESAQEQSVNWERLKKAERNASIVDGVPKTLPALLRAQRIQQKASTVGFDWPHAEPVWNKVEEEITEFKKVVHGANKNQIVEEFGDLLFSLVNFCRFINVNPENALRKSTEKFIARFKKVEADFEANHREMSAASLEDLDAAWEKIKSTDS